MRKLSLLTYRARYGIICAMRKKDDLDAFIARRTAMNPDFPKLMKAAIETRRLVRQLAAEREAPRL